MFNRKGSTLVESLLAFQVFITVLIIYVSLFSTLIDQEVSVKEKYVKLQKSEESITLSESFLEIIEQVLL